MNQVTDKLLATLDGLTRRVSPISFLIDAALERIVPSATAKACHPSNTWLCTRSCDHSYNCNVGCRDGKYYYSYAERIGYASNPYCQGLQYCWDCPTSNRNCWFSSGNC